MATCATSTTIYAFPTSASTVKTAYVVPILAGSPPCATLTVLNQTDYSSYQTAVTTNTTQDVAIDSVNTAIVALQNGTSTPNADILAGETAIFAATLTAMALIYGLKYVYRMLTREGVGHE